MKFKSQLSNFRLLFWWFRQILGDSAYENYLRSARRATVGVAAHIMSREEFFLDSLRRRYSSVSRCC